jgi:hypothetical protein
MDTIHTNLVCKSGFLDIEFIITIPMNGMIAAALVPATIAVKMKYQHVGYLFGRGILPWSKNACYPVASLVAPIDSEESADLWAEGQPKFYFQNWMPAKEQ